MAEHSPLPWKIQRMDSSNWLVALGTNGEVNRVIMRGDRSGRKPKASARYDADADFVVRACNSHDELLTVCRALLQSYLYFSCCNVEKDHLCVLARAAIARAEGKP